MTTKTGSVACERRESERVRGCGLVAAWALLGGGCLEGGPTYFYQVGCT